MSKTFERALASWLTEAVVATEHEICELNLKEQPTEHDERKLARLHGELDMALRISERFNLGADR